ncbi:MAG TPA: COX15/CtaA family protein, partial [Kofleriaceae bacterium]|nr:COX15/CtaA family protein [Kofleriaceae bacterium]
RRAELGAAQKWILIAVATVALQLVIGALVRHLGAAMVCLGMPTCTMAGDWLPDTSVQQLHMLHRAFGVIVALVTIVAAIQVFRAAKSWPALRLLAGIAPLLVLGQITLGIATVMTMRAVPIAVGHFAGATALWALWLSMWFMTRRDDPPAAAMPPPGAP